MKTRLFFVMVLGASLTMLVTPGAAAPPPETPEPPDGSTPQYPLGQEFDEPLAKEYPFDLKDAVGQSIASVNPQGERIDIAVTGDDEMDPSVALCAYDQYLIAYVLDGEIYGQRLTSGGDLLGGPFLISGDSYEDTQPDVACEWAYNRFVVVWRHNFGDSGDYDIRARGVYGGHQTSGSQLYGSELTVSDDEANEERPAIACNINEHTCLVAFEYSGTGSGDIYAQRVSVGGSDISKDGDRFTISTYAAEEHNPDVAWGGHDDNYLVAWQYLHDDPSSHYRIVVSHVYDTEQGTGTEERQHVGAWLINPDEGSNRHQSVPAVAYSRDDQNYLVAFQYDYSGDGSDYDIRARRYAGTGATTASGLIYVASSFDDESSPAVAYSGGPEIWPGGLGADQFLVTYVRKETSAWSLYGQAVKGTQEGSGSQLEPDRQLLHSTFKALGWGIMSPDVTGSINNGRYMVVWQYNTGGTVWDEDILGQLVAPYTTYLSLILRNY